jgi:hypothetical protein
MFSELLRDDIKKGIEGKNIGIPTGFKTTDSNTNGIQKSIYTLFGGLSGSGKTSYVDLAYVLNPYEWYLKNKNSIDTRFRVIYRSMERNTKYKLAKWACLKIFNDYGIIIDVPTMLGWAGKKFNITPELEDIIFKVGKYFDNMFESGFIEILEGAENPTGIYNHLSKRMLECGTIIQPTEFSKKYIPNDSNLITVIINDHIGKLKSEVNNGIRLVDKGLLDKHSEYMGYARDFFGCSPVDISQFNRSIGSTDRMKIKTVSPEPDDFKGTSCGFENVDIALALFNPYKLKVNDFLGYDIPKFLTPTGENRFRSISILKNSYGADDIILGLNFLGENGNFREMPKPESFIAHPEYYEKALNFK